MKTRVYSLIAAFCLLGGAVGAQDFREDPRYGSDPASREQNVRILNFFNDAYKAKEYGQATVYLRQLIENAPKATQNLYIRGVEIYKSKALGAQSLQERKMYVDSILWFFDKRIEAFGNHPQRGEAYLRGEKAKAFLSMMPADRERLFQFFQEALHEKHPLNPGLAVTYFNSVVESYRLDDVTPEQVIDIYERLSQRLAGCESPERAEAMKAIDDLFASSGAANCETVEKIYRPKYEADPGNAKLIETILALLRRGNCSSDFYLTMLEKYYAANPRPDVAVQLASLFQEKQEFGKAMEYLRIAINNETDPAQKTNFMLQGAGMALSSSSYREAAQFARQAIDNDPNNGLAYFILASAYAGGSGSACSGFDRQTAFWLVVDNLVQARRLLPADDPQQSTISQMIGNYSANFPKTEETFMRGLNPGDSYTVNCGWISGRTVVRER